MNVPLRKRLSEPTHRPLRYLPKPPHRLPSRREIQHALGLSVTVCIAAISDWGDLIITASDRRLSYGDTGPASDDTLKAVQIGKAWGVLYSANDVSPVHGIIEDARRYLYDHRDSLTLGLVTDALSMAWRKYAERSVVERHLIRLGIESTQEFRRIGLHQFGDAEFARLLGKIESFDPEISFLVYGFDQDVAERAHIFEVGTPGPGHDLITIHDTQGFGVIGSGSWIALGVLTHRSVGHLNDADATAYALCEAKFAAESAIGVGRATTLMAFAKNGKMAQFTPGEIQKLREIWEESRKNALPDDAGTLLSTKLNKLVLDE